MRVQEIDRAFFEALRLAVVATGNLPDVTQYNSDVEYVQAKNMIIGTQKELIEIYGVGTDDARDTTDFNRIVVDGGAEDVGSIGATHVVFTEKQVGGRFTKKKVGETSRSLNYEIRTISNSVAYDRLMSEIVRRVFGERRRIATIGDNGQPMGAYVLCVYEGSNKVIASKGKLERVHRFRVPDVWIDEEMILRTDVPPLTTVRYSVYLLPDKNNPVTIKEIK